MHIEQWPQALKSVDHLLIGRADLSLAYGLPLSLPVAVWALAALALRTEALVLSHFQETASAVGKPLSLSLSHHLSPPNLFHTVTDT